MRDADSDEFVFETPIVLDCRYCLAPQANPGRQVFSAFVADSFSLAEWADFIGLRGATRATAKALGDNFPGFHTEVSRSSPPVDGGGAPPRNAQNKDTENPALLALAAALLPPAAVVLLPP